MSTNNQSDSATPQGSVGAQPATSPAEERQKIFTQDQLDEAAGSLGDANEGRSDRPEKVLEWTKEARRMGEFLVQEARDRFYPTPINVCGAGKLLLEGVAIIESRSAPAHPQGQAQQLRAEFEEYLIKKFGCVRGGLSTALHAEGLLALVQCHAPAVQPTEAGELRSVWGHFRNGVLQSNYNDNLSIYSSKAAAEQERWDGQTEVRQLALSAQPAKSASGADEAIINAEREFAKRCFESAREAMIDGSWDEEAEATLQCAANLGVFNVQRVPYDPTIHGEEFDAEPGDPIWWWGTPTTPAPTPAPQGQAVEAAKLNLPWSVESEYNPDAESSEGGPESTKGFHYFKIMDCKGRVIFDSMNRDPAASLIDGDCDETGNNLFDADAKRDAHALVKAINSLLAPPAAPAGEATGWRQALVVARNILQQHYDEVSHDVLPELETLNAALQSQQPPEDGK